MKYFIVCLIFLFVSGSASLRVLYADSPADTIEPTPKIVEDQGRAKDKAGDFHKQPQSKQPKTKKTLKKKKGEDSDFSDYPKSFVIPKGVCETKEPVMTIEK